VKKALRQARAARTVAVIIGGFLACWTPYISVYILIIIIIITDAARSRWTPYTITAILTVTTGQHHSYSVNFAVVFLAFASSGRRLVSSFRSLVFVAGISPVLLRYFPAATFSSSLDKALL